MRTAIATCATDNPCSVARGRSTSTRSSGRPGVYLTCTSCTPGVHGPLSAQSAPAYVIDPSSPSNIQIAKLELALGAPANAVYRASATEPPTFSTPLAQGESVNFGQGASPSVGKKFCWRAELTPDPGTTQLLLGLQWSLQLSPSP